MLAILDEDIGGARVRRGFTKGGVLLRGGHELTGDEVREIPTANRRALADSGYLEIWPKSKDDALHEHGDSLLNAERFAIHRGGGAYDVIAGVKLNSVQLSKEEALAMAAAANQTTGD